MVYYLCADFPAHFGRLYVLEFRHTLALGCADFPAHYCADFPAHPVLTSRHWKYLSSRPGMFFGR